jgi:hypothetical protein
MLSDTPQLYRTMVQGIFYGRACKKPYMVLIPLQDGVWDLVTLDDLDVNYWVKQHEVESCSCRRRHLRRSFDAVPHTPGVLDGRYTVYFERPMDTTPLNALVRVLGRLNGCKQAIKGSVLIVKEGPSGFINMMANDILRSNLLLIR